MGLDIEVVKSPKRGSLIIQILEKAETSVLNNLPKTTQLEASWALKWGGQSPSRTQALNHDTKPPAWFPTPTPTLR